MLKYILVAVAVVMLFAVVSVRATVDFKTKRISKNKYTATMIFWLAIVVAIILFGPVYEWLRISNLTDSGPLSLFDLILLTAIVFLLYVIMRTQQSISELNSRFARLHEEISIERSKEK
jgi:hypothetical protein